MDRALHQHETHIGWRLTEENFPETFKSQKEKNKNFIHRLGSARIGRNCALGLSITLGQRSRAVLKTSAQFLPIRTSQPVSNIFIFFLLRFKSFGKIFLSQPPTYVCSVLMKRATHCKPQQNITT